MNRKNLIIVLLAGALMVAVTYILIASPAVRAQTNARQGATNQAAIAATTADQTVEIQPASAIVSAVSASGNIALVSQVDVAGAVAGTINQLAVQAGDVVTAGQLLIALDTTDLERALALAEVAVARAQNQLDQLNEPPTAADLATAQANLASAQTALANLKAGPTPQQLAAAQSALAAAQASYNTLVAGPDQDQLTQLAADLQTKQIALAQAQTAYDKVVWRSDVGMTAEAAALQQASIDYDAAKAAYDQATAPPTSSAVQSALSAIQNAKETLAALTPTDTALAAAQAQVVSAQGALDTLTQGPDAPTLQNAQLALQQAQVNQAQATANLAQARVVAPIAGTVLAVDATVGEQVGAGTVLVSLADTSQLELTVNVAEVDIARLQAGQAAHVTIDAFPGQTFQGKVSQIAPLSSSTSGIIDYPVKVRLTGDNLAAVRPGMTAVASLAETNNTTADEWFVPTNALQHQGDAATISVLTNGATTPVGVTTTGTVQGDWTLVHAADLHAGDQVVGSVTTRLTTNASPFGGAPGRGFAAGASRQPRQAR